MVISLKVQLCLDILQVTHVNTTKDKPNSSTDDSGRVVNSLKIINAADVIVCRAH